MFRSLSLRRSQLLTSSFPGIRNLSTISQPNASFLSFLDPTRLKKIEYRERAKIDVGKPIPPADRRRIVDHTVMYNTHLDLHDIFQKKRWDISDFNTPRYPIIIDDIEDCDTFSLRENGEIWTLDLPVKMPGKGWAIPSELSQFAEFIKKADEFEQVINPVYDSCYAYLCIDQRPVEPGRSQRRPGYHADSFVTPITHGDTSNVLHDSIYLASDTIPTVFNYGPFPFTDSAIVSDPQRALDHFEALAHPKGDYTLPNYRIIKMDPTVVHRVGVNNSEFVVPRTFAKLVFSTEIFNREGNDINRLFDYNWPLISRQIEKRNTSSVHTKLINGHAEDEYELFRIRKLVGMFDDPRCFSAMKNGCVTAYPATPGELLQTVVKGNITTQNRAKVGDWKVTTYLGDQYFIPLQTLNRVYEHIKTDALSSDYNFISKPDHVLAIEIDRLMRFEAPWGSMQYLMPGDYLVQRANEIYGVKKESFETNYSPI